MKIIDLNTTIVSIFKMDAIDWHVFYLSEFKQELYREFKTEQKPDSMTAIANPNGHVMQLENGEVIIDAKTFPIDRIVLEDRRIIISMQAETEYVEKVVEKLIKLIKSFIPQNPLALEPIIITNETISITKFNESINELFRSNCFGEISCEHRC